MFKSKMKISKKVLTRSIFLIVFVIGGIIASTSSVKAPEVTEIKEPANLPQTVQDEGIQIQTPTPAAKNEYVPEAAGQSTPEPQQEPEPEKTFGPQLPVQGEIIRGFSDGELVYSKTTNDYRIHSGIDIASEILGRVHACDDGVVESVTKDELMGITITISHTDGFVSLYSNLSTEKMVSEGDAVVKGQVISGVGDTALLETGEEGHLHFEIHKDGIPQNPEKYFK